VYGIVIRNPWKQNTAMDNHLKFVLIKDSWDQFVLFFFWSLCSNPWMNWKCSKQSNLWLSENFEYFEKRIQFQKILFRNQCRNKWAFKRYASCRSVFGLRWDICIHRKWITMANHGYPLQCSAWKVEAFKIKDGWKPHL
jgi:hypothetical protein